MNDEASRLERLRAEARYQRTRLALYRARIYAGRASSDSKLRDLERSSEGADERLRTERARAPDAPPPQAPEASGPA